MKRVVFVGVHNKPNMAPLDSLTKTGKLVDRVIKKLTLPYVKSNLFDTDHYPAQELDHPVSAVSEWAARVEYTSDDIVVCLGASVHDVFKHTNIDFIKVGHPASVWSNEKKDNYVSSMLEKIEKELKRV